MVVYDHTRKHDLLTQSVVIDIDSISHLTHKSLLTQEMVHSYVLVGKVEKLRIDSLMI